MTYACSSLSLLSRAASSAVGLAVDPTPDNRLVLPQRDVEGPIAPRFHASMMGQSHPNACFQRLLAPFTPPGGKCPGPTRPFKPVTVGRWPKSNKKHEIESSAAASVSRVAWAPNLGLGSPARRTVGRVHQGHRPSPPNPSRLDCAHRVAASIDAPSNAHPTHDSNCGERRGGRVPLFCSPWII